MQHYRCRTCGADAYSSADASLLSCRRCGHSLADAQLDTRAKHDRRALMRRAGRGAAR
jgi:ribosomal protein L37AE/L43A